MNGTVMRRFRRYFPNFLCLLLTAMASAPTSMAQATNSAPATAPVEQHGLDQFKIQLIPPQNGRASATDNIDSTEASLVRASAVVANLPAVQPAGRPVIGLVFEGGGAMGLAQIGVIQWLEEALVGGLYASGHSVQELKAIATGNVLNKVLTLSTPYTDVSYRRRQDRRDLPQAVLFGLKGGLGLRNSLLTDNALDELSS